MTAVVPKSGPISKLDDYIELSRNYKKAFFVLAFILIVLIIGYFISESYNIKKTVKRMTMYPKYLEISSKLNSRELKEMRLCDFYIASSFRSCFTPEQGYCSLDILKSVIKGGARFLWFDVFNESLAVDTEPIISHGIEKGNWQLSGNVITFDSCIKLISKLAFSPKAVNNYIDPLIIAINLNVNKNILTLKKMLESIHRHLGSILLGSEYGYNKTNIGLIKIKDILGKVIIVCSDGYEGSEFEEIVNCDWTKNMRLLDNRSIDEETAENIVAKIDKEELQNYNANNLSIVLPKLDKYRFFKTDNYKFKYGFMTGCQFIAFNYANIDNNMDEYISYFRDSSFMLKPKEKRVSGFMESGDDMHLKKNKLSGKNRKGGGGDQCPLKPTEDSNYDDSANIAELPLYFKNQNEDLGGCSFSTKCPKGDNWMKVNKSMGLLINSADKDNTSFNYGKVNLSAGTDNDGNEYYNWNPKLCCSTKRDNKIENQYVLSPSCLKPNSFRGKVGLKVSKKDIHKVPFDIGSSTGNYKWVHPNLCQVKDNKELGKGKYCLISKNTCPEDWRNTDNKDIELENNWKLCCRNLD